MCDLLWTAVRAHGGLSRWREFSSLEGRVSVRDVALEPGTPARNLSVIASTNLPLICLEDLQPGGRICSFTQDQMRLYDKSGALLTWRNREDMRTGRATDDGLDIEDIFRSSAALWVTLNSPFLFTWPGFVTREIAGGNSDCGPVRRLLVGFPPGLGNDTLIAVVSFDREGLMRNLRYAAEPSPLPSPVFYARHHEWHDGIVVGGHQYVHTALPRRDGTLDRLLLSMDIHDLRFR
jgi:hypothetical protein